jgi:hypothetical protein
MRFHYVWLVWASAFLVPWAALLVANPGRRRAMWRASAITALFGLTEPIFVPRYWSPPSLFDLAARTGFDIESLIFSFAIGGIGVLFYDTMFRRKPVPLAAGQRGQARHRLHRAALVAPLAVFVPLYLLPWNPIYASLVSLAVGAGASVACRPDLGRKTLVGGLLFFGLYAAFILSLRWLVPGYIEAVWNLPALSGVRPGGIPVEELLFGFTFGMYWTAVYEHLTWQTGGVPR